MKKLIPLLCLVFSVAQAEEQMPSESDFILKNQKLDFFTHARLCTGMAINYTALGLIAQHMNSEDDFKKYVTETATHAANDEVAHQILNVGEVVWKLKKEIQPTAGALAYYNSCMTRGGYTG